MRRPRPLMMMPENRPHDHNDDRNQEHKDGNAVDPMHVLHPLSMWRIRIPLLDIKIFLDLSPNSHSSKIPPI
jgi:hypothetical protein